MSSQLGLGLENEDMLASMRVIFILLIIPPQMLKWTDAIGAEAQERPSIVCGLNTKRADDN